MIDLIWFILFSSILFAIGFLGVITQTNGIRILISIEIMLNAANINFVAFNSYLGLVDFSGWSMALFVIGIAAAEAAIGLAIFISVYRSFGDITLGNIFSLGEVKEVE